MIKAHKIRLNPTSSQKAYFYRAAGVARFAWNWALEEYKRRKAAGVEVDWNQIKKAFRAKIDAEFPFFVPEGQRILAGGETTGTGCNGNPCPGRALDRSSGLSPFQGWKGFGRRYSGGFSTG